MPHILQDLLQDNEPLFPYYLQKLEQSVSHSANDADAVDVRLIAELTHKAYEVMRQLQLDVADTTAHELYNVLLSYVSKNETAELLLDTEYVLFSIDDEIVSFNLIDLIETWHHKLPFEQRSLRHARQSLRGEIARRYMEHPSAHTPTIHSLVKEANLVSDDALEHKTVIAVNGEEGGSVNQSSILAIGDIFTDAFIKLNEDEARVEETESGEKRLSLPLGSKPPYDGVDIVQAVGPGPNAAVSTARLGVKTGLISFLGDDQVGTDAITYLRSEKVSTDTVSVQPGLKTSYYYVLRYGAERTILVKNEAFNYTWIEPKQEPEWIYLALMSNTSWQFHEDLLAYLESHPNVKLAFQPGTFHFKWGVEKLASLYKRTHILILNREEAVDVTGESYDSIQGLANALHELGPQKVVITDGPNGSYASYDYRLVTIPNYPDPAPPVDRTGAGDAFASTIVAALALGETMDTALTWAPINSASVVQKIGAQAGLLSRDKISEFLANAPDWYKLSNFEG
ncbi:MAG: carbohydrate kinase family protein [Candidatus Microsaccharimonas sp.]